MQGKLSGADTALARWLVFCHTHCDLPLDYRVFKPILEKLCSDHPSKFVHSQPEYMNSDLKTVEKVRTGEVSINF